MFKKANANFDEVQALPARFVTKQPAVQHPGSKLSKTGKKNEEVHAKNANSQKIHLFNFKNAYFAVPFHRRNPPDEDPHLLG